MVLSENPAAKKINENPQKSIRGFSFRRSFSNEFYDYSPLDERLNVTSTLPNMRCLSYISSNSLSLRETSVHSSFHRRLCTAPKRLMAHLVFLTASYKTLMVQQLFCVPSDTIDVKAIARVENFCKEKLMLTKNRSSEHTRGRPPKGIYLLC